MTDEQTLYHLYVEERLSTTKIGVMYGVHAITINRWLRHYNIPLRPQNNYRGSKSPPNEEELTVLYIEQELSLRKIAPKYGVDISLVSRWLKRYGIPTRPPHTKKGPATVVTGPSLPTD